MTSGVTVPERSRTDATHGRGILLRRALIVFGVLVAGAVAWGGWWWAHPTAFAPVTDTWSVGGGQMVPIAEAPIHIGMAWPLESTGSVALSEVQPNVVVNDARADITVQVCEVSGDAAISSVRGDLSESCSSLSRATDTRLPLGHASPRKQLIMTIEPRQPGNVRIRGLDLTYSHGVQNGKQTVGEHVWLRFE